MPLRAAPHRVSIWRRAPTGRTAQGEPRFTWTQVATDVPLDLQLSAGAVEQRLYGRTSEEIDNLFADSGTDIRHDDGIRIETSEIASMVGRRFLVRRAQDWGARGGVQGQADETDEVFGGS